MAPEPVEAPPPEVQIAETETPVVIPDPEPAPDPLPPEPEREATAREEATTEIVTEATETEEEPAPRIAGAPPSSPRPRTRPDAPARTAEPEPARPAQTVTAPEPEPERPATRPDAMADAVAAAVASAVTGTGGAGTAPSGPPLTSGEIDGLRRAIQQCWSVGSASTDTLRSIVTVGISMNRDGRPESVRRISAQGPSDAATNTAYEIARRAILRCAANAQLPADKYDHWREIEIEFDYNGMRLR